MKRVSNKRHQGHKKIRKLHENHGNIFFLWYRLYQKLMAKMDSIQLPSEFALKSNRGARYLAGSAPRTRSAWRDLRWIHIGLVILRKALAPQFHCHLNSHNLTMHHCFTPFRNSRSEWPAQGRDLWDAHMSHGKPSWLTFVHAVASNISLANYCNQ